MPWTDSIDAWQKEAVGIVPPRGANRFAARGGLPGPAFFPEGLGVSKIETGPAPMPTIMAIGHNFGCQNYRDRIQPVGREDAEPTWRNLDRLLIKAGADPAYCFRTNWFIGLMPGNEQKGPFLKKQDLTYEEACRALLLKQLATLRPSVVLLLGPEVVRRVYQIAPALGSWKSTGSFAEIDRSQIGHSPREVEVPSASLETNFVALLHPSFADVNQGRRMKKMKSPMTEAQLVAAALIS
jgi:uracil-DNA glycosylase